jgi:spore coat protein U-like protein
MRTVDTAFAVAGLLLALCGVASNAFAQTRTGQFAVRANVQKDCQLTTVDLDFGTYRSDAATTGQTPLQVRCTPGANATISLSAGSSGNAQARQMAAGTYRLGYQLYRDAAMQDPINTTGMAFELTSASNTGQLVTFTVYGQIPAAQVVGAGNYVDMIQVTVQF